MELIKSAKLKKALALAVAGIIIALGIMAIVMPGEMFYFFVLAAFLIGGVHTFIKFFSEKSKSVWQLLLGALMITMLVAGIIPLFSGGMEAILRSINVIAVFVAILGTTVGVISIIMSFAKKKRGDKWKFSLILGVIMLALGVLIFCFPLNSAITVIQVGGVLIGAYFIIFGGSLIADTLS